MLSAIVGTWLFTGMLISGVWTPPMNPNLVMKFEFYEDGVNRLNYFRKDEPGVCDRKALYDYDGEILYQNVTWVSKENDSRCFEDPDMQMGAETQTHVTMQGSQIFMEVQVGDEVVVYIWDKKIDNEGDIQ
jgi:hypothetical protein